MKPGSRAQPDQRNRRVCWRLCAGSAHAGGEAHARGGVGLGGFDRCSAKTMHWRPIKDTRAKGGRRAGPPARKKDTFKCAPRGGCATGEPGGRRAAGPASTCKALVQLQGAGDETFAHRGRAPQRVRARGLLKCEGAACGGPLVAGGRSAARGVPSKALPRRLHAQRWKTPAHSDRSAPRLPSLAREGVRSCPAAGHRAAPALLQGWPLFPRLLDPSPASGAARIHPTPDDDP